MTVEAKNYTVNQEILNLVHQLFEEGYEGEAKLVTTYPAGIAKELDGCMALELSGFCKESLYLVQDTENQIVAFGRYCCECEWDSGSIEVRDIVKIASDMFDTYESRGYSLPSEFKELFIKYDFVEEQVVRTWKRK
jgi:hypothetical protein